MSRYLPGAVWAVIVVDHEDAQIAMAGEALHGPHIAPGDFQGLGDRRMPQPMRAHHAQARLFPQGPADPMHAAIGRPFGGMITVRAVCLLFYHYPHYN